MTPLRMLTLIVTLGLFPANAGGEEIAALQQRVIEYWNARVARDNLAGDALAMCSTEHRVITHRYQSPPPVARYDLIEVQRAARSRTDRHDPAFAHLVVVAPDGTRRYVRDMWGLDEKRGWLRYCDRD